jgi:uncharacterized membrane protein
MQRTRNILIAAVIIGLIVGFGVALLFGLSLGWGAMIGWVASATTLTVTAWIRLILRATPDQTRARAASEDPGRVLVLVIVLISSLISLALAIYITANAQALPSRAGLLTAFSAFAVLVSWFTIHTSFTLHYAHLYYREDGTPGGLEFPGGDAPSDLDFAYFAFTLGMAFQVSDVAVSKPSFRQIVLLHALVSFLFNTAIVALTLNLVVNFLG